MSWYRAKEYLGARPKSEARNVLGLHTIETDTVWRYFKKQMGDQLFVQSSIDERREIEKTVLAKMLEEDFAVMDPQSLSMVYEILHKRDTLGNPLTSMMARNLRVFSKISI